VGIKSFGSGEPLGFVFTGWTPCHPANNLRSLNERDVLYLYDTDGYVTGVIELV